MRSDCFAINPSNGSCSALTVRDCENCKFYKSRETAKKDRLDALEALRKKDTFLYYRDKYNLKIAK